MANKKKTSNGGIPVLSGNALIAAVSAAEAPLTGEVIKRLFFKQLGLDVLADMDFDAIERAPDALIIQPVYPHPRDEESS